MPEIEAVRLGLADLYLAAQSADSCCQERRSSGDTRSGGALRRGAGRYAECGGVGVALLAGQWRPAVEDGS